MASNGKGKAVVIEKSSSGKRNRDGAEVSGGRKRRNRGVLQFFEDTADVLDDNESDDSDFGDDFMEDEPEIDLNNRAEPGKSHNFPFFLKEEELSGDELERVLEERYGDGSGYVTYAEDEYESKRSIDKDSMMPSAKDPTIWKVKCMVGRERHSAFCLMQKYLDLLALGTKLQIISAFSVEHIKGFIYIEAERQSDVYEACNGLCSIYTSRVTAVPKNEVSHVLSVRSKCNGVSEGTWVRVKNGKYKGDLAEVVAVNDTRKRVTIRLIPRINLQELIEKLGGGVPVKRSTAPPAPRLISSSELEEFRLLIRWRQDRDTGMTFEVLDGLMLKDGYLYKKVSVDSLSCSGVNPSEEELLKFKPSINKDELENSGWLTQLFGERKKKRDCHINLKSGKGGGKGDKGGGKVGDKGEGTSESSTVNSFDVHDFVCFGRKDFGIIVGMEKENNCKILRDGPKGQEVITIESHCLRRAPFDRKFTAFDKHRKIISVNDTVSISEGLHQGKQVVVKQIYRGTIFLYDENETENCGYFCSKSQTCEKVKLPGDPCNEKGDESSLPGFGDFPGSPKSPLSPKKPWLARENNREFNQGDKDGMFSVGQTLRIRLGPLKGYLCRVLAIRRSDVTVKLDSQHKVLTVKSEHLSEVHGRSSASTNMDLGSSSMKPFDLLGTEGSTDWMGGAGATAGSSSWNAEGTAGSSSWNAGGTAGSSWNAGGLSAERSSWSSFPTAGNSLQPEPNSANPFGSVVDPKTDASEGKLIPNQDPSSVVEAGGWGNASIGAASGSQEISWKKSEDPWDKGNNVSTNLPSCWNSAGGGTNRVDSWGKEMHPENKQKDNTEDGPGGWGSAGEEGAARWNNAGVSNNEPINNWNKPKNVADVGSWDKQDGSSSWQKQGDSSWNKADRDILDKSRSGVSSLGEQDGGSSWGKRDGGSLWGKKDGGSSLGKQDGSSSWQKQGASSWNNAGGNIEDKSQSRVPSLGKEDGGSSWGIEDGGSSCGKQDGGSSWGNQNGGSSWDKQEGGSSWDKQEGGSLWGKQDGGCLSGKQDGSSSWQKQGASSWKKAVGDIEDKSQPGVPSWGKQDGGSSWGKEDGVSSCGKQDGGSSWGKQDGPSLWQKQGASSWNKAVGDIENKSQSGVSSWGKQDGGSSWNNVNSEEKFKGNRDGNGDQNGAGFSGWNRGRTGDDNDSNQHNSWNSSKSFEGGGRGTGGRRGRGGRGGRGRSFDEDRSTGWNKKSGQQGSWSGDAMAAGKPSSWNCGKSKISDGDQSFGWNTKGAGIESSDWKQGSGDAMAAGIPSSWSSDQGSDWGKAKISDGDQSSGWKTKSAGTESSDWKKGSTSNEEADGACKNGGDWDKGFPLGNSQNKPWKSETSTVDGDKESGWNKKGSWGCVNADEDEHSGWTANSSEKTGRSDDQGSGWNCKRSSDSGSSAGWGQNNSWKSTAGEASDWGQKSNSDFWKCGVQSEGGKHERGEDGNRGRGRGWRGGRGRGTSDSGGFGRKDNYDTGNFGSSARSGSWNDGNASSGWNKGCATNEETSGSGVHGDGWKTGASAGTGSSDWGSRVGDKSDLNAQGEGQGSGWQKGFSINEKDGETSAGDASWSKGKTFGDFQGKPWKSEASTLGGNESSRRSEGCWDSQKPSEGGWNVNSAGKGQDSMASDQGSGWDSAKTSSGGSATGWGSSNWKNANGEAADWSQKSNWRSSDAFGGDRSETFSDEQGSGGFGNRGRVGNWRGGRGDRGGFGGRGDRGGFGGRGGSGRGFGSRGGFGGRGSCERGGFGGRGRGRRDESRGWNPNGNGEEKPLSWAEGWKGNDGSNSWNQGGGSSWKP